LAVSGFARPEFVASVEWLSDHIDRPDVRVVDARWRPDGSGRMAWQAGHVPGSRHLDWAADLSHRPDGEDALLLAGPAQVAASLARIGLGDGMTVVVYDDTAGLFAARTWWSLRAYGLDTVRILDGGFAAWQAAGRPITKVEDEIVPAAFTPRVQTRMRLTTADVRGVLGSPDVTLIDARAPAEYEGLEGNSRRLGHIPGAVNIPAAATTRPGTQVLRDGAQLRELMNRVNLTRGRRMVCYDAAGILAAKLAFVLTLLGHDDVAVYDGGWTDWGERLDLPVER
jgi:thiosulfate/3-mercaptopyruvate sulfurtransferase